MKTFSLNVIVFTSGLGLFTLPRYSIIFTKLFFKKGEHNEEIAIGYGCTGLYIHTKCM